MYRKIYSHANSIRVMMMMMIVTKRDTHKHDILQVSTTHSSSIL